MDREILFRAKLKDWKTNPEHNRWIEGFYLKRKETTYCFAGDYEKYPVKTLHFIAEECMTDWGLPNDFRLYEIDPGTLCQYIEINDINKKKIFENDIVKDLTTYLVHKSYVERGIEDGSGLQKYLNDAKINIVLFDTNDVASCGCCYPYFVGSGFKSEKINLKECEVIGNKIDNPELLEGK